MTPMAPASSGCFIVLEGGEGSGKSTQAARLAARLGARGCEVVATFEPGATPRGAALRTALLDDDSPLDARAELMLLLADRAQHLADVIRPALARGAVVVCDRFTPSTFAYQGIARGLGVELVAAADAIVTDGLAPDVVVVLDVTADVAARRVPTAADRFEAAGAEFHERVRAAYRSLAARNGWRVVDGSASPDAVADAVWREVAPVLEARTAR
jgi:dTMP kinase